MKYIVAQVPLAIVVYVTPSQTTPDSGDHLYKLSADFRL